MKTSARLAFVSLRKTFLRAALLALMFVGGLARLQAQDSIECTEDDLRAKAESGGDYVFDDDCSITIANGPIIISSYTVIDGAENLVTLSGGGGNNLFVVSSGGTLILTGITLQDGQSTNGGAIYIEEGGTVELTDCIFSNNAAIGTNGISADTNAGSGSLIGKNGGQGMSADDARGGAIYNLGDLTVSTCQFFTNRAEGGTGGNGGSGEAAADRGGNGGKGGNGGAAYGGAIYSEGFSLVIEDSTFDSNVVTGGDAGTGGTGGSGLVNGFDGAGGVAGDAAGAGVYSVDAADTTISGSTFSNNHGQGGDSADGGGGTLGTGGKAGGDALGGGVFNSGSMSVENSTFYRNDVLGGNGGSGGNGSFRGGNGGNGGTGAGGGLCNSGSGTVSVLNCTFSTGSATGGGGAAGGSGGVLGKAGKKGKSLGGNIANLAAKKSGGFFSLLNSIVATNLSGGSGYGRITDDGHNIVADKSIKVGSGSLKKTDPKLGLLADNGGPTKTMAIGTNSPAFDAGDDAAAPLFDQRGVTRPQGAFSDVGAYELAFDAPDILGITTQPSSQTISGTQTVVQTNGGTVTLTVEVIADTPISYRWYFNQTNLVSRTLNSSQTENSLVLTNLSTNQVGFYFVVVSNINGAAISGSVLVTNVSGLTITTQPTNQVIANGGTASFSIVADGPSPLLYQWQFNGTNISGETNTTLTITNAQPVNIGSYMSVVTNQYGSVVSSAAALNMFPFITTQPPDQTVPAGSNVTFTAVANGSPTLTYAWHFNGAVVGSFSSYTKTGVQTNDAGGYYVTVANSFGAVDSRTATLTVTSSAAVSVTSLKSLSSTGLEAKNPIALSQVSLQAQHFQFAFPSSTGVTYEVQYKENLADSDWISLQTNSGTGEMLTNEVPANGANGFFRVLIK